jgi:hypothetical protein
MPECRLRLSQRPAGQVGRLRPAPTGGSSYWATSALHCATVAFHGVTFVTLWQVVGVGRRQVGSYQSSLRFVFFSMTSGI